MVPARIFEDVHRAAQAVPCAEPVAGTVEELHPIVLAIDDEDPILAVDPDRMGRHELAWPMANSPPAANIPPVRGKAVEAGIPVAVGYVDLAILRDGDVGRVVEGRLPMRLMTLAEVKDLGAIRREHDDFVRVAVGEEDPVVAVDEDAVRIENSARTVSAHERAVGREHHHRRIGPAYRVHAAATVHRHLTDHRRFDLGRQRAPVALDRIALPGKCDDAGFDCHGVTRAVH